MSEEILDQYQEAIDTWEPESITEVDSEEEAVKTLDDLWKNLVYQHREKYNEYSDLQASISAMSFDRAETRIDFTKMNEMRDDLVKIEGGLETLNLYRRLVLGEPAQPWIESELEEQRKTIKVRTRPGYEKYTDWESDQSETDANLNKVK
jgi:hypothetical protein